MAKTLTSFNLTPLCKVSRDDFFDIIAYMYSSDVDGAVLSHEASYASHIISVVRVLVSSKNIYVRIEHIVNTRQSVKVFALLPFRTYSPRKEQAEVTPRNFVGLGVSSI